MSDEQAAAQTEMSKRDKWGDSITQERRAELGATLQKWEEETDHDKHRGPFHGIKLTGADVFWLAVQALAGLGGDTAAAEVNLRAAPEDTRLHLTLDLSSLHLEGADLTEAYLERALLVGAHLERADIRYAHLKQADIRWAHLEEANLGLADLRRALLFGTHLEGAHLIGARLEQAILSEARLQHAILEGAELAGAYLNGAELAGAQLLRAELSGADLHYASFDKNSRLNLAHLNHAILDQVIFDNTNLAVVEWGEVRMLGDETEARESRKLEVEITDDRQRTERREMRKGASYRVVEYHVAARAYRSLSVALRTQGLSRDATRFHYRAEVMHRKELFHKACSAIRWFNFPIAPLFFVPWLLLLALALFAGYGVYHVWRLFLTYLGVVLGFAGVYYFAAQQPSALDALVLSVTSFHGRGLQPAAGLNDVMRAFAGAEAVLGLLIEGLFIAAFTRRVTGN